MAYNACGSGFWGWCNRVLCFTVSHQAAVKVSIRVGVSSEGSPREGAASKLTHMIVGRIHFLEGCWTKGFSSLPALAGDCAQLLSPMAALLHQNQQERESSSKIEVIIFCKLIREVIPPLSCHILLARSTKLLTWRGLHRHES